MLGLDADVAAHRDRTNLRADVGAQEGGGDFLIHRPLLGNQVALGGGRFEHHVAGDGGRYIPRGDVACAGKAQVHRLVLQVSGNAGVALRAEQDVAFGLGLVLAAVGVVDAEVDVGEPVEAVRRRERYRQLEALQFIIHMRGLAVAGTVDGVGQVELAVVGVIPARRELRELAAVVERH
ncbi:hypothetical protein D3C81_1420620 [compost metagenome]